MLERIDFTARKITKEEYKPIHDELVQRLVVLQQQARKEEVGLVVLFEGWNGAGKGSRISDLLYNLDARATSVYITENSDAGELKLFDELGTGVTGFFPPMQEFWKALGERGTVTFFDRGWYTRAVQHMLFAVFGKDFGKSKKDISDKKRRKSLRILEQYLESTEEFERQLTDDGYVVVKLFLHISEKEQEKRLATLYNDPSTRWRVTQDKLLRSRNYPQSAEFYEALLSGSDYDFAPWVLVDAEDKRHANLDIASALVESLDNALLKKKDSFDEEASSRARANAAGVLADTDPRSRSAGIEQVIRVRAELEATQTAILAPAGSRFALVPDPPSLDKVDRTLALPVEEYRSRLKEEQARLYRLELEMYRKRVPLMVMFEGWDAAGKGGAIKRVAQALDARSYTVFPSPAPTRPELLHPFLWRYWTRLPKAGHVGIYDRSWYGRVLVERVEQFASIKEWKRAYDEINGFEEDLSRWGAILLKFWVEVSREEQLERFRAREVNPNKRWKITDEDWRNRDKYPQYRAAVEDMLRLTSTPYAPWIILESDDKMYARVKALQTINEALEARLHAEG